MARKKKNSPVFIDDEDIIMDTSRLSVDKEENKEIIEEQKDVYHQPIISDKIVENRLQSLGFSEEEKRIAKQNAKKIMSNGQKTNNNKIQNFDKVRLEKMERNDYLKNTIDVKKTKKDEDFIENINEKHAKNKFDIEPTTHFKEKDKVMDKVIGEDSKPKLFDNEKPMDVDEDIKNRLLAHGLKRGGVPSQASKAKQKPTAPNPQPSVRSTSKKKTAEDDIAIESLPKQINPDSKQHPNPQKAQPKKIKPQESQKTELPKADDFNNRKSEHRKPRKTVVDAEVEEINRLIKEKEEYEKTKDDVDDKPINFEDLISDGSTSRRNADKAYSEMLQNVDTMEQPKLRRPFKTPEIPPISETSKNAINSTNPQTKQKQAQKPVVKNKPMPKQKPKPVIEIDEEIDLGISDNAEDIGDITLKEFEAMPKPKPKASPIKKTPPRRTIQQTSKNKNVLDKNKVFENEIDKGMPMFESELKPLQSKDNSIIDKSSFDDFMSGEGESKSIPTWLIILITIIIIGAAGAAIFLVLM